MKLLAVILSGMVLVSFAETEKLTVAMAANVHFAMNEIINEFEKESGISIVRNISSSGRITAQIKQGAPYDVFLSANMKYPESLYKEGFTAAAPKIYAYGMLVLWSMNGTDTADGISGILKKNVSKIAIANPEYAPYGEAAIEVLRYYGLYERVLPKLVYGESIGQTSQYILSRAVEAGFTAKSIVMSPAMKGKGNWIEINRNAYTPISQGIVILKHGHENAFESSQRFYNFIFSEQGRRILRKYGYISE